MPGRQRFVRRNPLEASFEILLGLALAVASLVPLGFAVVGLFGLMADGLKWDGLLVTLFGGLIFLWCAPTSWRLIAGRPRSDGGLLSPAVIGLAGISIAAVGVFSVVTHDWLGLSRGALFVTSGISTVMLAWDRIRRRSLEPNRDR